MRSAKIRGVLILFCLSLTAFTCAPSPDLAVAVRPDQANSTGAAISVAKTEFPNVEAVVSSFASKFDAKKAAECSPRWWWNRPHGEPCAFFSNSQHEGITIEAYYDPVRSATRVVLLKSPRVFGKYSTLEVEDAFRKFVIEPLRARYGVAAVKIDDAA